MAHAAPAAAASFSHVLGSTAPRLGQQRFSSFSTVSPSISSVTYQTEKLGLGHVKDRRKKLVAVLPLLSLAAETQSKYELITVYNDWKLDEQTLKNIYLIFSLFFCWGCCVFASMTDPFYDSDVYRDAGGDGTGNWIYNLEEEEEVMAREELWREELAREIEERVGELRELEESKKEKELV